jgi:hypothetical protein
VAVGLNQAEAAVAIAWDALSARLCSTEAVSDELLYKVCAISVCPTKPVAVKIARRVLATARARPHVLLYNKSSSSEGASPSDDEAAVAAERSAICRIVLSSFVKHIGHLLDNAELWGAIKTYVLEPLITSSTSTSERESFEELLSL